MDMDQILKKMRSLRESTEECNMTPEGTECPKHGTVECMTMQEADDMESTDVDDRGVDDGEDLSPEAEKALDDGYYKAIKSGGKVPEEVVEPERFVRYYEQKYGTQAAAEPEAEPEAEAAPSNDTNAVSEGVNISLDGAEADAFIQRLSQLAGQAGDDYHIPAQEEICGDCGEPISHCHCDHSEMDHGMACDDCGEPMDHCQCDHAMGDDDTATWGPGGLTMDENADHDFGHEDHEDAGEPVDPKKYMWNPTNPEQRFGKIGDNTMVKENANELYAKLKGDYRRYVAEAELAASNTTGAESPLTANSRNEFDKDPSVGEEPVTDGSRSPLSNIKRQKVSK